GDAVFGADARDHDSCHDRHLVVDRHGVRGTAAFHGGVAVRAWLRVGVRERRDQRVLSSPTVDRHLSPWYILRRRAFPFRDGRGGDVRYFRRHVFLVPENVRAVHERHAREVALLAHLHRCVLHLHADALSLTRRVREPVFRIYRRFFTASYSASLLQYVC